MFWEKILNLKNNIASLEERGLAQKTLEEPKNHMDLGEISEYSGVGALCV